MSDQQTENPLAKIPRRTELIERGSRAMFYGVLTAEMSKDDLLMLIGYLDTERVRPGCSSGPSLVHNLGDV